MTKTVTVANIAMNILFFFTFAFQAAAGGEECVGIPADSLRLACFDKAFEATNAVEASSGSAAQAIDDLTAMVSFDDGVTRLSLVSLDTPCSIQTEYLHLRLNPDSRNPANTNAIVARIISNVDLSNVERVGQWGVNANGGGMGHVTLFTERGTSGTWMFNSVLVRNVSGFTLDSINASTFVSSVGQRDSYSGRDANFNLIVREYIPDRDKINQLLLAAIAACRQ